MQYRTATEADIAAVMRIIDQAKQRLAAAGVDQWQRGYPNVESVRHDVAAGVGRVLVADRLVVAYAALIFTGEPAYAAITSGTWSAHAPYGVLHRVCVAADCLRQGCAARLMRATMQEARAQGYAWFRIDTHPDNRPMQHLITSLSFDYRGDVVIESRRLAYEKKL